MASKQVSFGLVRAVSAGIVLPEPIPLKRVCAEESFYLREYFPVVSRRVDCSPLLLPEEAWALLPIDDTSPEHPGRELGVLMSYALWKETITPILFASDVRLSMCSAECPYFVCKADLLHVSTWPSNSIFRKF